MTLIDELGNETHRYKVTGEGKEHFVYYCSIPGCSHLRRNNQLCQSHGADRRVCEFPDCDHQVYIKKCCYKHAKLRDPTLIMKKVHDKRVCEFPGCDHQVYIKKCCYNHAKLRDPTLIMKCSECYKLMLGKKKCTHNVERNDLKLKQIFNSRIFSLKHSMKGLYEDINFEEELLGISFHEYKNWISNQFEGKMSWSSLR